LYVELVDRRQLVAMAEEITYDVRMLTGTAVRQQIERAELERSAQLDTGRTRVVLFAVTESCLVHLRNLDDFLGGTDPDHVVAGDFIAGWTPQRFLTADERAAIDSSLSALAADRHAADPDWPLLSMAARAFDAFNAFVDALDPEAAAWFGEEIAEADAVLAAWT
jgi:hypothetical protein